MLQFLGGLGELLLLLMEAKLTIRLVVVSCDGGRSLADFSFGLIAPSETAVVHAHRQIGFVRCVELTPKS